MSPADGSAVKLSQGTGRGGYNARAVFLTVYVGALEQKLATQKLLG